MFYGQYIGFGAGQSAAVTTLIAAGAGTIVSGETTWTANGGAAAAFDGTTAQALAASARSAASVVQAYIGKDWGSGNSKIITRFRWFGPTDIGIFGGAACTISLEGNNSAPGAFGGANFGGTVLYTSGSIADANSTTVDRAVSDGITATTAYRYHYLWAKRASGNGELYCAEAQFYEDI